MGGTKGTTFHSRRNQEVVEKRSHRRLTTLKKQGLIKQSPKKSSPAYTEHLLRMRPSTIEASIKSLINETKAGPVFTRTSPISNEPNFQNLRFKSLKKRRVVVKTDEGYHDVNPDLMDITPVKKVSEHPLQFISPGETLYRPARTSIQANVHEALQPLEVVTDHKPSAALFGKHTIARTVELSYANLALPAGRDRPINNRKSQGGKSANELAQMQWDDFEKGLVEMNFGTPEEMQDFKKMYDGVHREHTHLIASHFGILRDKENQPLDPRDAQSTFVAPAALNSEMMLFEKFVDFLLYLNYRRHGMGHREKTVSYSCEVTFVPDTTQPSQLRLRIVDHFTGKPFEQIWMDPCSVTDKPGSLMYTTLLQLLKASLEGQALAGAPVQVQHPDKP